MKVSPAYLDLLVAGMERIEGDRLQVGSAERNGGVVRIVAAEGRESSFESEVGGNRPGPAGPVRAAARTAIAAVVGFLDRGYLP